MQNITVDELKKRIDAGEKLNLLDVREPEDHEKFNIGGLSIRLKRIQDQDIEEIENLKDEEVICYCNVGYRSPMACLILEHLGFTNTLSLTGGLKEWQEKFTG